MLCRATIVLLCLSCVIAFPESAADVEVEEQKTVNFAKPGKNVTSRRGESVEFNCEVNSENGEPVPAEDENVISIWMQNNLVQFAGSQKITKNPRLTIEGRNLVVSDIESEDAGKYTCQLSTWNQPVITHFLIVQTPPSVKPEKNKIVATAGDDVILTCSAAGSPKPTISWQLKDEPVLSGETRLTGEKLVLDQVSHQQAGRYMCIADNGVGEPAKAFIDLDIMYKPVITIEEGWIHSGENSQAELTCIIHGQPNPQVSWFRDGVELSGSDSAHWTQSKIDGNVYTLELKNLKREHFGTYECRASNTIGRSEEYIELSGLAKKAEFTSEPRGKEETTYRKCVLLVGWDVKQYEPIDEPVLSGETRLTGEKLVLDQVSHQQAGRYMCIADNGVGEPAKAFIDLDIMYKPVITIEEGWIHSGENSQAELTCIIHGQPNPQVSWFRDGVELSGSDSAHWTQSKIDGNVYTLELKNLKRLVKPCMLTSRTNTIGRSEEYIELSGLAKKAEFTSEPRGKEETIYRLKWTVESYSPIKEYLIKYRQVDFNDTEEEMPQWETVTVPEETGLDGDKAMKHHHSHEYLIKNLSPATNYEVTLQVSNSFGSNNPSTFRRDKFFDAKDGRVAAELRVESLALFGLSCRTDKVSTTCDVSVDVTVIVAEGSVQQYSTAGSPSSSSKNDNDSGKRKRLLYSQASQEHKPEVMELLCDSFVNREPIGCGVCITKTDFLSWAPRVLDELTAQGFSAVAQDAVTGQVVGFTLNEVETPNSKHGLAYSTQWCQNEKMNVIFKFLGDLDDKAKPYEFFKVDKLFRFQMMGVHEKYGNLGIGRNLKDWAIRTAIKSSDCEVGVVEATGRFSQSINASYGFQVFAEIPYAEYKGEDGKSVFDLSRMSGHLSCKFMAKELFFKADMRGSSSMRTSSRKPPFLVIGLVLLLVVVCFKYWNLMTLNFDLQEKLHEFEERLLKNEKQLDGNSLHLSNMKSELDTSRRQLTEKSDENADLTRRIKDLTEELDVQKAAVDDKTKEISKCHNDLKLAKSDLESKQAEINRLESDAEKKDSVPKVSGDPQSVNNPDVQEKVLEAPNAQAPEKREINSSSTTHALQKNSTLRPPFGEDQMLDKIGDDGREVGLDLKEAIPEKAAVVNVDRSDAANEDEQNDYAGDNLNPVRGIGQGQDEALDAGNPDVDPRFDGSDAGGSP
ncbi:unnamed protein product [Notodromas monacha]|uniref:Uncharacterized protein n=1 Tax=Notodromas monacha TaxID=399045 RepID=A0A7R9BEG3_9CRUS|nr:unnamed protein product [Notodromas monacha]CAG0913830.1 unnamed protein product [Notodromas monacha]